MGTDLAELSSIASTLGQLAGRVGAMAETAQQSRDDETANELFAAERALEGARRRLARLVDRLR